MNFAKLIILIFLGFIPFNNYAHSEYEVSYIFKNQSLTIHFTPKTSIDILKYIGVVKADQQLIKFEDYYDDLTNYFNKNIHLNMDNEMESFVFKSADLTLHDAFFEMDLVDQKPLSENFKIQIDCFKNIFRHPINYVEWHGPQKVTKCFLNMEQNVCENGPDLETHSSLKKYIFYIILILFVWMVARIVIR